MKITKLVASLFFCASTVVSIVAVNSAVKETRAEAANPLNAEGLGFNKSAPDVESTGLRVVLNQSATTETSQSFRLSFNSDVSCPYVAPQETSRYPEVKGIYFAVDDASYPRDTKLSDLPSYDVPAFPTGGTELEISQWRDKYQKKDADDSFVYNDDGTPVLLDGHLYASQRPVYDAYVYRIEVSEGQNKIVIPRFIKYGTRFTYQINYIGEDVFNAGSATTEEEKAAIYKDLKTIVIGGNVLKASDNAIWRTPSSLEIKVAASKSETHFAESWTDSTKVTFDYSPTAAEKKIFNKELKEDSEDPDNPIREKAYIFSSAVPKSFASEYTYVVGYYNNDSLLNKPLTLEYSFVGENTLHYAEFELSNNKSVGADVVGQKAGAYTLDKNIEFRIDASDKGKVVDQETLVLYNIFEMKERLHPQTDPIEPNLEKEYSAKIKIGDVQEVKLSDFMDVQYNGMAETAGYGRISLKLTPKTDIYQNFKKSIYETNKKKIARGEYEIRCLVKAIRSSYYVFTMKDGTKIKAGISKCSETGVPLDYVILNPKATNDFQYFFKECLVADGFSLANVVRAEVQGLTISMDICATKTGTSQIVGKSDIQFRFGYTDLVPENSNKAIFNGNLFLVFMICGFVCLFVCGATGYYFFAKYKYKNDEFKRMNTRKYLNKVGIGLLGSTIVFTAISFIILRFGLFNNAVVMHNPLDPFVIAFGVVGLIAIGYFIKFLVVTIKQEKERRKRLKLKLDEDVASDGTN